MSTLCSKVFPIIYFWELSQYLDLYHAAVSLNILHNFFLISVFLFWELVLHIHARFCFSLITHRRFCMICFFRLFLTIEVLSFLKHIYKQRSIKWIGRISAIHVNVFLLNFMFDNHSSQDNSYINTISTQRRIYCSNGDS